MIKIIGRAGCAHCQKAKKTYEADGIDFQYILINSLTKEEEEYYISLAEAAGLTDFPIILSSENKVIAHNF